MGSTVDDRIPLWPQGSSEIASLRAEAPTLRVYPAAHTPAPTILILPGGGYWSITAAEGEPIARRFNDDGFTCVVATYRVGPYDPPSSADHHVPLRDAARAMRLTRQHADAWGVDPHRVAVLGFSAGGHLAGSLATAGDDVPDDPDPALNPIPTRPDAAILCYPAATMTRPFAHEGSMANLLGPGASDADRARWSVDQRISSDTPPMFIWHTGEDEPVPVENALMLAAALRRAGVPFELHVFPEGRHGIDLARDQPGADIWPVLCSSWLRRTLG